MPPRTARTRKLTFPLTGWIENYLLTAAAGLPGTESVPHYRRILMRWAEWAQSQGYGELDALETPALQRYVVHLQERPGRWREEDRYKEETVIHYMRVLRIFGNWMIAEGEIEGDPFARLRMPKAPKRQTKPLRDEELRALLRVCEADKRLLRGRRDLAMVLVLLDTGLRVSELVSLRLDSVGSKGDITVMGKGKKERTVQISDKTRSALFRYVRLRDDPHDALWVGQRGPFTKIGVESITRRRGIQAGIGPVHPHRLRHTFAVNYLRAGGDVYSLKALMGHESLQMLMKYVEYAELDLQEKHKSFSPVKRLKW